MIRYKKKNQTDPNNDKNSPVEIRLARYTGWLVAVTALLVIATGLLAYFGYGQIDISRESLKDQQRFEKIQADSTSEQLRILRDQEIRQLRAYVYVEATKDFKGMNNSLPYFLTDFVVKNSGLTPAYDISFWNKTYFKLSKDTIFDTTSFPAPSSILNSGNNSIGFNGSYSLSKYQMDNIIASTGTWYTWGEIRYRDAFGKIRHTKFRYKRMGIERKDDPFPLIIDSVGNYGD